MRGGESLTHRFDVPETKEITVNLQRFETSFSAWMAGSKRSVEAGARQQMKGIIRTVVKITPPGHSVETDTGTSLVVGVAAKRAGEATVKRDIRSIYGTPREAYELIKAVSIPKAKAFWKHSSAGEFENASTISREVIGKGLYAFDDGKLHHTLTKGKRPRPARYRGFYVTDPTALKDYIKAEQGHVFWLAAGWTEAARAFGVSLPQMIARHPAPGDVLIQVTEERIRLVALNAVEYASGITDMQRRIQYAVDFQAGAMDRILADKLQEEAKRAGLIVAGTLT